MKRFYSLFAFFIVLFSVSAETVEHGFVKEYRGKEAKTPLAGVELMIKGAPSTISDTQGSFTLKFATLAPGEKVDYTEIYKEGFVIFNQEAMEAWRISNNGRPFTIVMCRESEFRALKKKFYGIIEESYQAQYLRQKALAERLEENTEKLKTQLKKLEEEYNEKMSNINTYVELFSRIDRSEMDETEAKALDFMESGKIDEAIKMYEELQLERQVQNQLSKWNAAEEMRRAADGMESQAQADLVLLASKMKKQISLYSMGGKTYDAKRLQLINQLIPMLYRLNGVVNESYNEDIGVLIVQRASFKSNAERLSDYEEAAALPSAIGLKHLAGYKELMPPSISRTDSIRSFYTKALTLCTEADSIYGQIKTKLNETPDAFFTDASGNVFPFKRLVGNEAALMPFGPLYSAHIEGDVTLPSVIYDNDTARTVTQIANFAFGRNFYLKSVALPEHCREVKPEAFAKCDSLVTVFVNPDLKVMRITNTSDIDSASSVPIDAEIVFMGVPKHIEWITDAVNYLYDEKTHDMIVRRHTSPDSNNYYKKYINPLLKGIEKHLLGISDKKRTDDDRKLLENTYRALIDNCLFAGDTISALGYAQKCVKNKLSSGNVLLSVIYMLSGKYRQAIDAIKKVKNKSGIEYNQLAYAYAHAGDFANAHKAVDTAISLAGSAQEKADYVDSKGEIYLMQRLDVEAKKRLDTALAECGDYFQHSNSKLYYHFFPQEQKTANADSTAIQKQMKRNLTLALIAFDYLKPRVEGIEGYDFESFKRRKLRNVYSTPADDKDFEKTPFDMFVATIWSAGQNLYTFAETKGIPFSNEWIGIIDSDGKKGFDVAVRQKLAVLISINELFKQLPCSNLTESDVKTISICGELLSRFMESLENKDKQLFEAMLAGKDLDTLMQTFGIAEDAVAAMVGKCAEFINTAKEPEIEPQNIDTKYARRYEPAIEETIENSIKMEKQLINYVALAQLVANVEYPLINAENFRSPDYEELLSIGIIAIQVMVKNKTEKQLAKYTDLYISTAMRWAIRNEMRIRYDWYALKYGNLDEVSTDAMKKYEDAGIDAKKGYIRVSIYNTVKDIYYLVQSKDINSLSSVFVEKAEDGYDFYSSEIMRMATVVFASRDKISPENRDCYDYLFSKDSNVEELHRRFTPKTIKSMLDEVKKALDDSGLRGA